MTSDPGIKAFYVIILAMISAAVLYEIFVMQRKRSAEPDPRKRLGDCYPELTNETALSIEVGNKTYRMKISELQETPNGDLVAYLPDQVEPVAIIKISKDGVQEIATPIRGFS